ncbi:uncharacterized protein LOC134224308 [Armigeres subalbatus]|uniref:uncharacterized protein LOC134224308 n=1 Tax=Armigeres subalbatus TaxID=124917 RepID=UPI002ED5C0CC
MVSFSVLSCTIFHFTSFVLGWDLSSLGIQNFTIKHVSLYKSRAFITIEDSNVSLVEASWPENKLSTRPRVLCENDRPGRHECCDHLNHVICTDVDSGARLWILDRGDNEGFCSPKIVIRSLILVPNKEIMYQFSTSSNAFHSIVVDPIKASDGDTRAFVTMVDTDYILIFSLFKQTFGKLKFERKDLSPISPISLSEVAINQNHLYISDSLSGRLFLLPVKTIRQLSFPECGVQKMILKTSVTYLGRLLGRAKGLKLDLWDNLYYIIPRDGAVVKWKPGHTLRAENHSVIYQREINVTQIILGVGNKAWVIASEFSSDESKRHCLRISK